MAGRGDKQRQIALGALAIARRHKADRRKVAAELGVSYAALDNAIKFNCADEWRACRKGQRVDLKAVEARLFPAAEIAEPVDPIEAERQRLERIKQLREEKDLLKDIAGEKNIRAFLKALVERVAPQITPPPRYVAPKERPGCSTETIVLQLSDWHAYEVVKAGRTRGFNAYNGDIFGARVEHIVDSAIAIKRKMERGAGWRFPRLVIGANGDFVSGTIHELERHTDASSIVEAVAGCAMMLAAAVRDLSAHFPEVDVFCTAGNHGRLPDARRMQQKDPRRSWDTFIYLWAQSMLRDVPHVRFEIPDSYSVAFEAEGWNFLQTHGHDVKSWNSIPWYGLNRLVGNINALEASRGRTVHYYLFGHFHEKSSLEHASGESFINGSVIGGNEFSMNSLGKMGRPAQWMLGVHREHGVTWRFPLGVGGAAAAPSRYRVRPWEIEG